MDNLVTIVPGNGPTVNGTKVRLADGSFLPGVTRLVITAEPNDVWRATIEVRCHVDELPRVMAQIDATSVGRPVTEYGEATPDQIMRGLAHLQQERQA